MTDKFDKKFDIKNKELIHTADDLMVMPRSISSSRE